MKKKSGIRLLTKYFSLILFFFYSSNIFAQTSDSLPQKTIMVYGKYKVVLGESFKLSLDPPADTSSSTPPELNYFIDPPERMTVYEAPTIKAVNMKNEPLQKLYHNFLKAGFGNNATYNGELYLNSLRNKNSQGGLHIKHLSGSPSLKDVGDAAYSHNDISLFGKLFLENSTFSTDGNYHRDVVRYYGYNSNDTLIPENDIKQRFSNLNFKFGLQSHFLDKSHLDHDISLGYYNLSDSYDAAERDITLNLNLGKFYSEKYLSIRSTFDFGKQTDKIHDRSWTIVSVIPGARIVQDKLTINAGLNLTMENRYISFYHAYPEVSADFIIADNVLSLFANFSGGVRKNSLLTLSDENPFINTTLILRNTNEKIKFKGGLKGNFSNTTSFVAHIQYSDLQGEVFFANQNPEVSINRFDVVYDDCSLLNIHAEVSHKPTEKISFLLSADNFFYSLKNEMKPWHKPSFNITLKADYNIADKIYASAAIYFLGQQYAKVYDANQNVSAIKVDGYSDINFGIDYRYTKILSLFVHFNNLGFTRYYKWNNYPSERFNALAGFTFSF